MGFRISRCESRSRHLGPAPRGGLLRASLRARPAVLQAGNVGDTHACPAGLSVHISWAAPSCELLPALWCLPPRAQAPSARPVQPCCGAQAPDWQTVPASPNSEALRGPGHALFRHAFQDGPGKTQICVLAGWTHVLATWSQSWTLCLPDQRHPPRGTHVLPSLHKFIAGTFYHHMCVICVDTIYQSKSVTQRSSRGLVSTQSLTGFCVLLS